MKKTFLIGSLVGLFFMLFLATAVNAAVTITQNTFVNCSIGHCFNVTAGVSDTAGGLNITQTNISRSSGTCQYYSNTTSGNSFNVIYNCSGTALTSTDIIVGFTNASNDYFNTTQSSNTYPNNAPTISAGAIIIDSHESSDTTTVSASDADSDSLNYSVTAVGDSSLVSCTISGNILTATRVNDTKPTATTNCTVSVTDGTVTSSAVFTITVNRKSMLQIYDLDVYVDGERDSNLDDGETISDKAKPESTVKFDFVIKSLFDEDDEDEEDIEIENIFITVTIKNIDDEGDDDLEEETKEFDLNADEKSSTKSVEFDIPMAVDEGDYEIEIVVEGEEKESNVEHKVEWTLTLRVEKEKHDMDLKRAEFDQTALSCDRETTFNVKLVNFGSSDEDEIILTVENAALGINIKEEDLEIDEGDDWSKSYTITVGDDILPGTYKVLTKVYYDSSDYYDKEFILNAYGSTDLVISKCVVTIPVEEEEEEEDIIIVEPEEGEEETTGGEVTREISFMDTSLYLVLLVTSVVILAGIFLTMIFRLFPKR